MPTKGNSLKIEAEGYKKGHNPMMGEFTRKFGFNAVSYDNKKAKEFTAKVHKALADIRYLYFAEVKLDITIFCDEKKRMETPELADMDNYAKLLCDCLKGPRGLLIDDTQIQSLSISWIDTVESPYFEVNIKGLADEYIMKPITLYEMPDGLFYPLSSKLRTKNGTKDMSEDYRAKILAILHGEISFAGEIRTKLTKERLSPAKAFSASRYLMPLLTGFHKSRIVDSGFEIHYLKDWEPKINPRKVFNELKKKIKKR